MEGQGPICRYVFRTVLGRGDQARETGPSQTGCAAEASRITGNGDSGNSRCEGRSRRTGIRAVSSGEDTGCSGCRGHSREQFSISRPGEAAASDADTSIDTLATCSGRRGAGRRPFCCSDEGSTLYQGSDPDGATGRFKAVTGFDVLTSQRYYRSFS